MSELPVTQNLQAYRGDTWTQTFRFVQADIPIDWSGTTVAAWATSRGQQWTLTTTTAADGNVTISMPATGPLAAGSYNYDIEVTQAGVVTTWVRGKLTIEQDVTNA